MSDKAAKRQEKEERLAAKLRENLRRRKSQTRGRVEDEPKPGTENTTGDTGS